MYIKLKSALKSYISWELILRATRCRTDPAVGCVSGLIVVPQYDGRDVEGGGEAEAERERGREEGVRPHVNSVRCVVHTV